MRIILGPACCQLRSTHHLKFNTKNPTDFHLENAEKNYGNNEIHILSLFEALPRGEGTGEHI